MSLSLTNVDEAAIERIVAEVVRRLTVMQIDANAPNRSSNASAASNNSGRCLRLEERLITLDTLRGRLDAIEQLSVTPTAVITPAVRDELRDRGIELNRTGLSAGPGGPPPATDQSGVTAIDVIACGTPICQTVARQIGSRLGVAAQTADSDRLPIDRWRMETCSSARQSSAPRSIVVSDQVHDVLWQLQSRGVKAARCVSACDVSEAVNGFNARVLLISGKQSPSGELLDSIASQLKLN